MINNILLSGHKGSGKDTFAEVFRNELGALTVSLADPLKEMCSNLYDIPLEHFHDPGLKDSPLFPVVSTDCPVSSQVINLLENELVYHNDVLHFTPRALLVLEGTITKRTVMPDFWVNKVKTQQWSGLRVVTDVRCLNEIYELTTDRTLKIRINRPGCTGNGGIIENELDDYTGFDIIINNTSTLEQFQNLASDIISDPDYSWARRCQSSAVL